jgi:hypothetical protein
MAEKKTLTVAIDFDDTYTADPSTWYAIVDCLIGAGHKVICVSARRNTIENRKELMDILPDGIPVLLSYDESKREYARKNGYSVDIWIDDMPEAIPTHAEFHRARGTS